MRRREVTVHAFIPPPISTGLSSTCMHSICVNLTVHEYMHNDTHIVPFAVQRQPKVTLLQFGCRTVSESARPTSRTALSALSIGLPVYLPTFSIWLWLYQVYLTCLLARWSVFLFVSISLYLFFSLQFKVCFKSSFCQFTEECLKPPTSTNIWFIFLWWKTAQVTSKLTQWNDHQKQLLTFLSPNAFRRHFVQLGLFEA